MKLNKNTRQLVEVGTILKSYSSEYKVTSILDNVGRYGNGKNITVCIIKGNMQGRYIYMQPLSNYYGCEIITAWQFHKGQKLNILPLMELSNLITTNNIERLKKVTLWHEWQ